MQATIRQSVGRQGVNLPEDVRTIQRLLNPHVGKWGARPLALDGVMGTSTSAAIEAYQRHVVKIPVPDGRVDPAGRTWASLNGSQAVSGGAGAITSGGKVTGKTLGVNQGLVDYLKAVSGHYGKEIHVTSGRRSASDQADKMWDGWAEHLEHGKIYKYLIAHDDVRRELDGYHAKAHSLTATPGEKVKAKQDFKDKVVSLAGQLSKHLTGEAVDVALNTDLKVLSALKTGLHYLKEQHNGVTKCHHFDTSKQGCAPVVSPATQAQWPVV